MELVTTDAQIIVNVKLIILKAAYLSMMQTVKGFHISTHEATSSLLFGFACLLSLFINVVLVLLFVAVWKFIPQRCIVQ